MSLLYANPINVSVPLNLSRFYDYGAASQNGAASVRYIQVEVRDTLDEQGPPNVACAANFNYMTYNNDPSSNATTLYALANVSNSAASGGSTTTSIPARGAAPDNSSSIVGANSTSNCEIDGPGSDFLRGTNIFDLHFKIKLKNPSFTGTMKVYVRASGADVTEPAIRQYIGTFTIGN